MRGDYITHNNLSEPMKDKYISNAGLLQAQARNEVFEQVFQRIEKAQEASFKSNVKILSELLIEKHKGYIKNE